MYDLKCIAIDDRNLGKRRSGDDFEITLNPDSRRVETDLRDQRRNRRASGDTSLFTIDGDGKGVGRGHIG